MDMYREIQKLICSRAPRIWSLDLGSAPSNQKDLEEHLFLYRASGGALAKICRESLDHQETEGELADTMETYLSARMLISLGREPGQVSLQQTEQFLAIDSVNDNGWTKWMNYREPSIVETPSPEKKNDFVSARQQLIVQAAKGGSGESNGKRLGLSKRATKFPIPQSKKLDVDNNSHLYNLESTPAQESNDPIYADPRLQNIEPRMIKFVLSEIMDTGTSIGWEDIAGLDHAKATIKEMVVWPMLRPDIFTGLRGPPKGLLLFGPPGTGKTLIGKCIANQSGATFFSISASSLTSKWVGEGEKMVRALFSVARCQQPSVIFVDEIDSLLTQRSEGEVEATRRLKTEFLIQFDGVGTNSEDRLLVIGATNRPQEIDEAARRRLVKRLYIPLPDFGARISIVKNLLKQQQHSLTDTDLETICRRSEGYSGSDMHSLCREASLGPIRSIQDIRTVQAEQVRPIRLGDFEHALTQIRASVSERDLDMYSQWNGEYGCLEGTVSG